MGWWSAAVMGGDEPLDYQLEILALLGYTYDDYTEFWVDGKLREEIKKEIAERFEKAHDEIGEWAAQTGGIAYQALGVEMMGYGLPISPEFRALIVQAAEEDEWAAEQRANPAGQQDRVQAMQSLISDIQKYQDGTPTELSEPDIGLLNTIFTAILDGKTGLVNR